MKKQEIFGISIICAGVIVVLFWQFFLKGLLPFPGNYLLAWYEPWKTEHIVGKTIVLAHKPVLSDVFRQTYPFKVLAMDMFKHFQLPLWNPYNGGGQPLLATNNIGLLDPFNLVYVLFTGPYAWGVSIILQAFFLCLGMYLFCREVGLTKGASVLSTVSLFLSGVVSVHLLYGIFGTGYMMLPFGLFLLARVAKQHDTKLIFLLPVCIAILIVSVLSQITLYVLGTYVLFTILFVPRKEWGRLGSLFLLGIGLAGIQLLPTAELFSQANMTTSASTFIFKEFLLPWWTLVSVLVPNYFGNAATYNYWGSADYVETAFSLGLIPMCLALFGFFSSHTSRSMKKLCSVLIGISLLVIVKSPLSTFIGSLPIPILSTSAPTRIFFLATFALSLLAGYGVQGLLAGEKRLFVIRVLGSFSGLLLLIFGVTGYSFLRHIPCGNHIIVTCRTVALRNTLLEMGVFFIFLLGLFVCYKWNRKFGNMYAGVFIILILVTGIYNAQKFYPFSSKDSFVPTNSVSQYLTQGALADDRVLGFDNATIGTDFATALHYYDPNYYHPLYVRRYGELVAYANSDHVYTYPLQRSDVEVNPHSTASAELVQKRERLMQLLSIHTLLYRSSDLPLSGDQKTLWQWKDWYAMENPEALPRAYVVSDVVVEQNAQGILGKLFDPAFDPRTSVVVEEKNVIPNSIRDPEKNTGQAGMTNKVVITSYHENEVTVAVQATRSGMLVLTDTYYPGWKAYIDGRETKIYRANYALRAIVIPSGEHIVRFSYQPLSVVIGAWISGISVVILGVWFARFASRK